MSRHPPRRRRVAPILSQSASRRFVAVITIVSITVFVLLLLTGAYWPQRFQNTAAKFFVCVLLAFCFSIVMFVVYPQDARIKNIPLINLPVELVGPPSLFVISLLLLSYFYPGPPNRFFHVRMGGEPAPFQLLTFEIKTVSGECRYHPTQAEDDKYMLGGVYVEFAGGSTECRATIGNDLVSSQVVFSLSDKSNVVEVESK